MDNEEKLESLINEFSNQRESLKNMIIDLEKIKTKIELLFPENLDKRYVRYFEEKMKSLTSLFGTILDIRKEIMKSVKVEFDLIKSLKKDSDDGLDLDEFDMDEIESSISKLQELNNKQKQKREHLRNKGEVHVKLESINQ